MRACHRLCQQGRVVTPPPAKPPSPLPGGDQAWRARHPPKLPHDKRVCRVRWVVTPSCECCGMRWPRAPCQRKWVQKKQQNRTGGEADGRRGESWGAREPLDSPRGPLAPLTRGRGGVGGRNGGGVSSRSTRAPAFVTRGCCQHTASYLVHSAGWGFCACTYTQSSSPARPRKYPSPVEPLRPPSPRAHGVSGDVGATPPPRGCPHLASGGGGRRGAWCHRL